MARSWRVQELQGAATGPRSRGAVGVADVAGERGDRRRAVRSPATGPDLARPVGFCRSRRGAPRVRRAAGARARSAAASWGSSGSSSSWRSTRCREEVPDRAASVHRRGRPIVFCSQRDVTSAAQESGVDLLTAEDWLPSSINETCTSGSRSSSEYKLNPFRRPGPLSHGPIGVARQPVHRGPRGRALWGTSDARRPRWSSLCTETGRVPRVVARVVAGAWASLTRSRLRDRLVVVADMVTRRLGPRPLGAVGLSGWPA